MNVPAALDAIGRIEADRAIRRLNESRLRLQQVDPGAPLQLDYNYSLRSAAELGWLQFNEDLISRCNRIDGTLAGIDTLDPSFRKVQAIRSHSFDLELNKFFIQRAPRAGTIEVDGQERPVAEVLQEVVIIQENKTRLTMKESREKTLLITIENSKDDRNVKTNELYEVEREIKENAEEIKTKKNETIRGWTLQLSELTAFTWPYFLVSLLGLKIARIRYFEPAGRS